MASQPSPTSPTDVDGALVAQGSRNQDIGERLSSSSFTGKRHIANILTKLDLPSMAAAAAYAIREGLARQFLSIPSRIPCPR